MAQGGKIEYEFERQWWDGPETDVVFRPIIPIAVRSGDKETRIVKGLIDSGSNTSYVDEELAEDLGVDLDSCHEVPIGGLGLPGNRGRVCTVKIYVVDFDYEYESHVIFAKVEAQTVLLGVRDFFKEFNVLFEATKEGKGFFTVMKIPRLGH